MTALAMFGMLYILVMDKSRLSSKRGSELLSSRTRYEPFEGPPRRRSTYSRRPVSMNMNDVGSTVSRMCGIGLKTAVTSAGISTVLSACRRSKIFKRKVMPKLEKASSTIIDSFFRVGDFVLDTGQSLIFWRKRGAPSQYRYDPYGKDHRPQHGQPVRRTEMSTTEFFTASWQHLWDRVVDAGSATRQGAKKAWGYVESLFSNEALFDSLRKEDDLVIVLRRVYELFPPKRPNCNLPSEALTDAIYRSPRLKQIVLKKALYHYHPDKNPKRQYGLRWWNICNKITAILLDQYDRLQVSVG
uniref:Uncharacterized protein n=1 Tax=Lotharella oceanica TaxID=641309 RepID=A0A7S2U389_9EUKA